MVEEKRKCENCGLRSARMSYIPFNGGLCVCNACYNEWQRLGEPNTLLELQDTLPPLSNEPGVII